MVRVVIAIAVCAIAVRVWIEPRSVIRQDFVDIKEMQDKGADAEYVKQKRKELYMRMPYSNNYDTVNVQGSVSID